MANYTSNVVPAGSSWGISAGDNAKFTSVYGVYTVLSGAVDSSALVYNGGTLNVYSGGITVSASVENGGALNVYSSGSASSATVSSGGALMVLSAGVLNGVSLKSGAVLDVRSGATASNVSLSAGASALAYTQSSGSASIARFSGDTIVGTASGLNGSGRLLVGSGGRLNNTVLSGGSIRVSSGGSVSGAVLSGGLLAVSSAGSAFGVGVLGGAAVSVGYGAVVSSATLYSGATVNSFTQTGGGSAVIGAISAGVLTGAVSNLYFSGFVSAGQGATLTGLTADAGRLVIGSGATVSNARVNSAGVIVSSNAAVRGLQMNDGASLTIQSGASVSSISLSSGAAVMGFTQKGGTAASVSLMKGDALAGGAQGLDFTGSLHVGQNGAASSARVRADGVMNVRSGGTAVGGYVSSGGAVNVESGGIVSSAVVLSGGAVNVESGARLSGIVQSSGGNINLTVLASASSGFVSGTNEQGVFTCSGGTATNAVVYEGGSMIASSGAVVRDVLIRSGGLMSASLAADITGSSVDMGIRFAISNGIRSGLNTLSNFVLMVESGYEINGQVLRGGGVQHVGLCGRVSSTTVSSGGRIEIEYGGTATDLKMADGAGLFLDVYGPAATTVVSGIYLSGGGTFSVSDGVASGLLLSSGVVVNVHSSGTILSAAVTDGGILSVASGGTASNIVQNSGGAVQAQVFGSDSLTSLTGSRWDGTEFSLQGGIASSFLLENGGSLDVASQGLTTDIIVGSGGEMNVRFGGVASGTEVESGGVLTAVQSAVLRNVAVRSGGELRLSSGAALTGTLYAAGGFVSTFGAVSAEEASIVIEVPSAPTAGVMISDLNAFAGALSVSLRVDTTGISEGTYTFAGGADGFAASIFVYNASGTALLGTFQPDARSFYSGGYTYTLQEANDTYAVVVSEGGEDGVRANLMNNGYSQVVAWDQARGAVGYVGVDGSSAPAWAGVYNWGDIGEQDMWQALGVGHFQGSGVDHDGILLYNVTGTTFAAWTDLNDPSYGYVSLCHVDGNFMTKSLAQFSNSGYDDVVIYDGNGSVGIVSGAAEYHDVWHVDDPSSNVWDLVGAGDFGEDASSLVFYNNSNKHVYLWDNQDPTFATWNWTQTDKGILEDGWEIAAIGDFQNDGKDDIVIWQASTGYMFACEDGDMNNRRWVGLLDPASWEVASVGDYNGDGHEDLLLRETTTGWGGLGYWGSANADNWTDMNARVENNSTSNFGILVS